MGSKGGEGQFKRWQWGMLFPRGRARALSLSLSFCWDGLTKHSVLGNLARPFDGLDLLHAPELRREAAVDAKYFLANYGSKGQAVEDLRECLEELCAVFLLDLVVEAVNS